MCLQYESLQRNTYACKKLSEGSWAQHQTKPDNVPLTKTKHDNVTLAETNPDNVPFLAKKKKLKWNEKIKDLEGKKHKK